MVVDLHMAGTGDDTNCKKLAEKVTVDMINQKWKFSSRGDASYLLVESCWFDWASCFPPH